jgi:hypothetical protein
VPPACTELQRCTCPLHWHIARTWRFKASIKDILGGALEPTLDGRSTTEKVPKRSPQAEHVEAWLHWLYWSVAEPLADTDQNAQLPQDTPENETTENLPPLVPAFDGCDISTLPVRHLAPGRHHPKLVHTYQNFRFPIQILKSRTSCRWKDNGKQKASPRDADEARGKPCSSLAS